MLLSSKGLGSAMIIAGTSIGAGMLAIPATVAACGFWIASLLLVVTWFIMLLTALLLAEVNLSMENGSNFTRMAYATLGKTGRFVTWIGYLLLLYSLTAAYTAGGGNLVSSGFLMLNLHLPAWLNSLIFILILGALVYSGTRTVDHANKLLMLLKFITFLGFLLVILSAIRQDYLNVETQNINYLWLSFPILVTSFGFHHVIPSLRTYVQSDRATLRKAIIIGSIIPLIVYILWIAATLGSIPLYGKNSFQEIISSGDITGGIVLSYHSGFIRHFVYSFEAIAVTTSFLGVTLGLFDFNRDTYGLEKKTGINKLIVFIITFLPPLLFAIYYPSGFKVALGYASIFVAVLLIALPAAMVWVVRGRQGINHYASKALLVAIIGVALLIIGLEIATIGNLLPSLV